MAQSVTRTTTEQALDLVLKPNSRELVENNYTLWPRCLKITTLTANLGWTITDEVVVTEKFPQHHKKQLLEAVLNYINK